MVFIKAEILITSKQQTYKYIFTGVAFRSISEKCPGKMRNLAPVCLNGLSKVYLSGGISAVSAQHVEQEHEYIV